MVFSCKSLKGTQLDAPSSFNNICSLKVVACWVEGPRRLWQGCKKGKPFKKAISMNASIYVDQFGMLGRK